MYQSQKASLRLRNFVFYINNVIQKQDATDIRGMVVNNCCQCLNVQEDLSCLCPTASLFLLSVNAFWEICVCLLQAETMDVNFLPFIYYLLALVHLKIQFDTFCAVFTKHVQLQPLLKPEVIVQPIPFGYLEMSWDQPCTSTASLCICLVAVFSFCQAQLSWCFCLQYHLF